MLNSVGPPGPRAGGVARRRPPGAAGRRAPGSWSASGAARSTDYAPGGRARGRGRGVGRGLVHRWRSRSTSAVPTSRTARACSPTRPTATAEARGRGRCGLPRWAKLSPNVPDLVEIAGGALEGGADGADAGQHAARPGPRLETGRPVLGAGGGGLSGPAVHPVAVRAVWECRAAFPDAADRRRGRRVRRAATPSSCSWPGPTPSRWARRPSATPGRRGRCCASWRGGASRRHDGGGDPPAARAGAPATASQRPATARPGVGRTVGDEGGRDG